MSLPGRAEMVPRISTPSAIGDLSSNGHMRTDSMTIRFADVEYHELWPVSRYARSHVLQG